MNVGLIEENTEELKFKILHLQKGILLKSNVSDENFWNIVNKYKYICLKIAGKIIHRFHTFMGLLFLTMNIIISKYRA